MLNTVAKEKKTSSSRAAEVAALLLEVIPGAMKELRCEARRVQNGALTIPQFRILAHLGCEEATNNKSLAEALGVSVAATSRMVDLLVKRDLVERVPGTKDKRENELGLTPKGEFHLDGIRVLIQGRLEERLSSIPAKDLVLAKDGLKALKKTLARLSN